MSSFLPDASSALESEDHQANAGVLFSFRYPFNIHNAGGQGHVRAKNSCQGENSLARYVSARGVNKSCD